jgi:cardiolipin synthase A/B
MRARTAPPLSRTRKYLLPILAVVVLLLVAVLAYFVVDRHTVVHVPPGAQPSLLCGGSSGRACQLSLFAIEPNDGPGPLTTRFAQATTSIDYVPFGLDDPSILQSLVDARGRGVQVRVMLEPSRAKAGDPWIKKLQDAGVETRSTNPAFALTHTKYAVVDGNRGLVLTFNSAAADLSSRRDFAAEDDDSQDAAFLEHLFEADWDRVATGPIPAGFAVSPDNSDEVLATLLGTAQRTLDVYAQKLLPSAQLDAVREAAARGVTVRILRAPPGPFDPVLEFLQGSLRGVPLQIQVSRGPRVHAKVMVVDGSTVFMGSENIEDNRGEQRREIGIIFDDAMIAGQVMQIFEQDWGSEGR